MDSWQTDEGPTTDSLQTAQQRVDQTRGPLELAGGLPHGLPHDFMDLAGVIKFVQARMADTAPAQVAARSSTSLPLMPLPLSMLIPSFFVCFYLLRFLPRWKA